MGIFPTFALAIVMEGVMKTHRAIFSYLCIVRRLVFSAILIPLISTGLVYAQTPCPTQPTVDISSSRVPDDVCIPTGFAALPIKFFDDYSWKSFIAMVWPAASGKRGIPDATAKIGSASGPLVFETLKAEWEIFTDNGVPSKNWEAIDTPNPCAQSGLTTDDFVLGTFSFSKFGNLGQAGSGKLVGSLLAQNRTYVRYSSAFNKPAFDQIIKDELYLIAKQKNVVLANGAITIKASWIDMTNVKNSDRYHTRMAWLFNPVTKTCSKQLVGLTGLHIVQKTKSRPQWIWTSFEQVDNVPPSNGVPMAFHDGGPMALPKSNPLKFPPEFPPPNPFNVDRQKPIHPDTVRTNDVYRNALKGTKWQFYQLVVTQWPVPTPPAAPTVDPKQAGTPEHTFPGNKDATSAFANTTLETFDQTNINKGCMACHDITGQDTDFVWSLATRGIKASPPPQVPSNNFKAILDGRSSMQRLRKLLATQ